jgi:hypothetical protein
MFIPSVPRGNCLGSINGIRSPQLYSMLQKCRLMVSAAISSLGKLREHPQKCTRWPAVRRKREDPSGGLMDRVNGQEWAQSSGRAGDSELFSGLYSYIMISLYVGTVL